MASSDAFRTGASHLHPVDTRKRESKSSRTPRHMLLGGVAKTSQSAFEYFRSADIGAPFKWVNNWKRKRNLKAKNERVQQPTYRKRNFLRFIPSWIHTAKRKKADHAGLKLSVSKLGKAAPVQANAKSVKPGKGTIMKGYFKSLVTLPKSRDHSQFGLSTNSKSSFKHTFSLRVADSSASHNSFRSACSDFDFKSASSCQRSPFADNDLPKDECEMNPPKLARWGYWNDLAELNGEIQTKEESQMFVESNGGGKICAKRKFLKLKRLQRRKRSQMMSGPVCDAAKELEALQLEQCLKEKPNEGLQVGQCTLEGSCKFVKTSCDKEKATKNTFGCYGFRMLSRSSKGKLIVQNQLCDEGSKGGTAQTPPRECSKQCTETTDTKRIASTHMRQPLPVDLEEFFSRLITSSDDSITQGTRACGISVAGDPNTTRTGLQQVPSIQTTYKFRSGNTPQAASCRYGGDLASLNAKMDSRFEQVLKAIDIVADQVKKSAESQQQTESLADEEESDQSRLISSSSSELGTVEIGLSPLRNCISQSRLLEIPVIKEFKGAVDDARFKMRVLAGLLTVEKDAKMASARDFQSKEMILTMGMIGAQMLEGETLLEKPWHIKYVLDYCISSIFFNGPHGSSNCICRRPRPARINFPSRSYDSFCNDIELSSMTFDLLCDDATVAVEELVGSRTKDWSEALTNMFWNCAVCCFHVHKLLKAIHKGKGMVRILHPDRSTRFEASAMDPLDTGDFKAFHKKVHFTIFSGFMLEGTVLCRSQVYLEPNLPGIRL